MMGFIFLCKMEQYIYRYIYTYVLYEKRFATANDSLKFHKITGNPLVSRVFCPYHLNNFY